MIDGDRNTKYYNLKMVNKRRKNKILMLKEENGMWIKDEDEIKKLVNDFWKNFFSLGGMWNSWKQTSITFPEIMQEDIIMMDAMVSDEEVRKAVFGMKPWKAPRPNGFLAGNLSKISGSSR